MTRRKQAQPEQPEQADSAAGVTSIAQTLDRVVTTDDAIERRRLARALGLQIERLVGRTADNAQLAVWSSEEWTRQQIGDTNEMIAELADDAKKTKAERAELLQGMRQLVTLGQDTARRVGDLDNTQGLMAGHLSALTDRIGDLVAGYNELVTGYNKLDRRVTALEEANAELREANAEKKAQLGRIEHQMQRFDAFMAMLTEQYPDAVIKAEQAIAQSHGAGA